MTCVGEDLVKIDFVKITRHSEDNYILSPKNLLKRLQEDDEHVEMVKPSPDFVIQDDLYI